MFAAHTIIGGGERVFDGRSAILFATVAGVSLGLLTGGSNPPPPGDRGLARPVVFLRGSALVLLGLALTEFVRPPIAVILDYYGVAFLLLIPALFLARWVLGLLATAITLVAPFTVAVLTEDTSLESIAEPAQLVARWFVFGNYPVLIWLAFLVVGLILARSGLHNRLTASIALASGSLAAVVGYGSALLLPDVTAAAHSGTTAEVVGSGGVAVAIIGALSLLDSASGPGERVARVIRVLLAPVAAAGAMALTLYTAHAIVLAIIHATAGNPERWQEPQWAFPALCAGSLAVATLWRRFIGAGPLEAGLRTLTRVALR